MTDQIKSILKDVFGYDEFWPLQDEIIDNVLNKNDSLVVMPTGGGKSLCYQVPALVFEGLTIVVSPLISLMKDQVRQLTELGIPVALLNSSLSYDEYNRNVQRVKSGQARLLYLAPETLMKPKTLALLSSVQVDCLAIDEAHCISEWGHDFRPEYRQIVEVRSRFPSAVCIALTATATPRVQEDIKNNLGFDASNQFISSFNRENLFLQIVQKTNPLTQTFDFLEKYPNQSGIIYCFSRKQVDELYEVLSSEGFSVKPYHAGLPTEERKKNQELFIHDDVQIIVATIAFGMGINKPNVRFVIHYDLPKNIESYYQEIGRAGRDGLQAQCLLLFSYGDTQKIRYFINQKTPQEQRVANVHLDALVQFAETDQCRRIPLLTYFGEDYAIEKCAACDNCQGEDRQLVDITIPAQKFLSCVKRTREIFGATHIIDVLRGSEAQKVISRGHQNLSTYGIGREYSKKQWRHLSRQFIQKGLLTQDPTHGSLKLTDQAYEVFKGEKTVMGLVEEEKADYARGRGEPTEYDRELFELLRAKRKELADQAKIPPYIIFSDRSLIEMAAFYPRSRESFSAMYGVGNVKLEKYSEVFLNIIGPYCDERQLEEKPKRGKKRRPTTTHKGRHLAVGEAYNDGQSVAQLMAQYKVKQSTIMNHLFKYLQEGQALRTDDDLLKLSSLPEAQQEAVMEALNRIGAELLRPLFDAFNGEISYDELSIIRLHYLSKASG